MLEDKMKENETPEDVFFKYAADCAYDLFSLKLISEEDYKNVLLHRNNGTSPSRDYLQRIFPNAVRRIGRLANSLGREIWDVYTVRKYFLEEHNNVIDRREDLYQKAAPQIRSLCKVRIGTIVEKELVGGVMGYKVDYGGMTENVVGKYLPNENVGDKISTHWRFAVENVNNYES